MDSETVSPEDLIGVFPQPTDEAEAEDRELLSRIRVMREQKQRDAVLEQLKTVGSGMGHPGVAPVISPDTATSIVKWAVKLPKDVGIAVWDVARNLAELSLDAGATLADAQFEQLAQTAQGMGSKAAASGLDMVHQVKAEQSTEGARALRDLQARQGEDLPPNLDDPTSIDLRDLAPEFIDAVDKARAWAGQGDTAADVITQKIFQFAGPFAATMRVMGGLSRAPGVASWLANAGKAGAADFLTSYAVFDPHEARFADLLKDLVPEDTRLVNAYIDYAMSDPADTDAEGLWKNAVDGAVVGLPFVVGGAVLQAGRALKLARAGALVPVMLTASSSPPVGRGMIGHDGAAAPQAGAAAAPGTGLGPDARGRGVDRPSAGEAPAPEPGVDHRGAQSLRLTERPADASTAAAFRDALQARFDADAVGKQVAVLQPEDLTDHRVFLTEDGGAGFAISPSGEIVGLFKSAQSPRKGLAREALRQAVEAGGTHLNAFDTALPELYAPVGFVEVARTKFLREFAPAGWDFERMGEPDIVFMRYDPTAVGKPYTPGARYVDSYEEGLALARGEAE